MDRTYTVQLELTDIELGAIMCGLHLLTDPDHNPHLTDETFNACETALSKLEEAM